jgi:hypothetical protein
MEFSVQTSHTIPPLAWYLRCNADGASAICGSRVEIFGNGFVEGCWDDTFANHAFDSATNFFGSGLIVHGDRIVIVGPSHPIDNLFMLRADRRTAISNSLAYLVEAEGIDLPVGVPYGRRFASLANGMEVAENRLYAGPSGEIRRVSVANIELHNGAATIKPKQANVDIESYEDYRGYLENTLSAIFENGADPARQFPYTPLSTCSSGYDSTACSAMAARLGCREGVTLSTARGGFDDSGRNVLEALGMKAIEFQRDARANCVNFEEAEFLATGMGGEDFIYSAFEPELPGRILLTGFFADAAWHTGTKPGFSFERGDNSGASLSEFRLRAGFTHLPMPVVGFSRLTQPKLLKIAQHEDMRPFSVKSYYDKPVPRRIAEESGVPRDLFGQSKKAASILFHRSSKALSERSLDSFRAFRKGVPGKIRIRVRQSVWWTWWQIWRSFFYLCRKLKIRAPARLIERTLFQNFAVYEYSSPVTSDLLFLWGLEKTRKRYRGVISPDKVM